MVVDLPRDLHVHRTPLARLLQQGGRHARPPGLHPSRPSPVTPIPAVTGPPPRDGHTLTLTAVRYGSDTCHGEGHVRSRQLSRGGCAPQGELGWHDTPGEGGRDRDCGHLPRGPSGAGCAQRWPGRSPRSGLRPEGTGWQGVTRLRDTGPRAPSPCPPTRGWPPPTPSWGVCGGGEGALCAARPAWTAPLLLPTPTPSAPAEGVGCAGHGSHGPCQLLSRPGLGGGLRPGSVPLGRHVSTVSSLNAARLPRDLPCPPRLPGTAGTLG